MGAAFSESRKQLPGDDRLDAGRDALDGAVTVDDPAHEDSGARCSSVATVPRSLVALLIVACGLQAGAHHSVRSGRRAGPIRAQQRSAAGLSAAFSFPIEEAFGPQASARP
jgi:hypothetical protein